MGFEDLEKKLRDFFSAQQADSPAALKQRVRRRALQAFVQKTEASLAPWWQRFLSRRTSSLAFGVAAFFVLFNLFPGRQSLLSAGKIVPEAGLVEIVRDGKRIVVTGEMNLEKGDKVIVGNNGTARVVSGSFSSTATARSQFRIVDNDAIFLERGSIINQSFEEAEVSTKRGFVKGVPGAAFQIVVSETGETKVVSKTKDIGVFDWRSGELTLQEGEEVKLRTDTDLTRYADVPTDLNLSTAQLLAIRSKLVITRTKLLTGLEKKLAGKDSQAERDFVSAKRSFRSIVQVLDSSRDLDSSGKRKNLDLIPLRRIAEAMVDRAVEPTLVSDAEALESLFILIESKANLLAFGLEETPVETFNRFVLLDRVFSLAENGQTVMNGEILKDKYVVAFLRRVQNSELKIDQITTLNTELAKLPTNELARDFLLRLEDMLAPDLAEMLDEKIERVF